MLLNKHGSAKKKRRAKLCVLLGGTVLRDEASAV